jgi:restriction system protein
MPIPDYQSLMLPVLRSAGSDEISMSECRERVAKDLGLSDEDLAQRYPSGAGETVFANRVAWAKIYLTAAGVLDATRRGYFQISDEGRRLLVENPSRIDNALLRRYPRFVSWLKREPVGSQRDSGGTSAATSQSDAAETQRLRT